MTVVYTTVVFTFVVCTFVSCIFCAQFHLVNFRNIGTKKNCVFPCVLKKIFVRAFLYIYKP